VNPALFLLFFIAPAYAQTTVQVPDSQPCFLNYTAGPEIWRNCGITEDFLATAMMPWEYVTGGNFTLIFVSLIILATYIKYQKTIYPLIMGTFFIPMSVFVFPQAWVNWAIILGGISIGIMVWDAFIKQTKEY
jgi:hypothetical protein